MEAIMDTIVDSLFCFFVTLGEFELNKPSEHRKSGRRFVFHREQRQLPVSRCASPRSR